MIITAAVTAVSYRTVLHLMCRVRLRLPIGKPRDALDVALRVMGGGGSGPIKPQ